MSKWNRWNRLLNVIAFPAFVVAIGIPELFHIVVRDKHEAIVDALALFSTMLVWQLFGLADDIRTSERPPSSRFSYTLKWPFCFVLILLFACLEVLIRILVPSAVNLIPSLIVVCTIVLLLLVPGIILPLLTLRSRDKKLYQPITILFLLSIGFMVTVGLATHSFAEILRSLAALVLFSAAYCWVKRKTEDLRKLFKTAVKVFPLVLIIWLLLRFLLPNLKDTMTLITTIALVLAGVTTIWLSVAQIIRNWAQNFHSRMLDQKEKLKIWQDQIDKLKKLDPSKLSSTAQRRLGDLLSASQQAEVDWLRISKILVELKEEGLIDNDESS